MSNHKGRALLYQRTLLTQEPNLKLELMKTLKDVFKNDEIGNAFDEELKRFSYGLGASLNFWENFQI